MHCRFNDSDDDNDKDNFFVEWLTDKSALSLGSSGTIATGFHLCVLRHAACMEDMKCIDKLNSFQKIKICKFSSKTTKKGKTITAFFFPTLKILPS